MEAIVAEPPDERERDRDVTNKDPERVDTNEKADDLATVTQPGGQEEAPMAQTDKGRSVSPRTARS